MPTPTTESTPLAAPLVFARGQQARNRFFLAPLTNKQSNPDGTLSDDEYTWLRRRGEGGFGLTMTCAAFVTPVGQAWEGQLGVANDVHLPGLRRLAEGLSSTGTRSSVQLHHGGRRSDPALHGSLNVAPWGDPAKQTRALTTSEVHQAVAAFVEAAERVERAGFDGVEVHGAHGYLICQFLDGRYNLREDGYGGSLEDRGRVLFEVLDGIRESTGPDFTVGLRLTPQGSGVVIEESLKVAAQVLTSGLVEYLDMSLWDVRGEAADEQGGLMIDRFAALERGDTKLGVAGKILTGADAEWCLNAGADFVSVGTAAIVHHDFAQRCLADPAFESQLQPVTREHLEREGLGSAFIDYLASGWDDFVR